MCKVYIQASKDRRGSRSSDKGLGASPTHGVQLYGFSLSLDLPRKKETCAKDPAV